MGSGVEWRGGLLSDVAGSSLLSSGEWTSACPEVRLGFQSLCGDQHLTLCPPVRVIAFVSWIIEKAVMSEWQSECEDDVCRARGTSESLLCSCQWQRAQSQAETLTLGSGERFCCCIQFEMVLGLTRDVCWGHRVGESRRVQPLFAMPVVC